MQEYTRKINRGFQLTLPQSFRDSYHLNIGDYVRMHEESGKLVIEPVKIVPKNSVDALKALFSKAASNNFDDLSEEEIMELVLQEIKKSRKGNNEKQGKRKAT